MASTSVNTLPKVLIFGHSFIDRLQNSVRACPTLLSDFGLKQCIVNLAGFSGLCIGKKLDQLSRILSLLFSDDGYDIAILQLGSNDINTDTTPVELGSRIVDFAKYLITSQGIKIVYICQIFTRQRPRYIRPDHYEVLRQGVNDHLELLLHGDPHIKYWAHKRIFQSPLQLFLEDGVHLNVAGTKKFYKSLRQAIIFAVEDFKSLPL